MRWTGSYDGSPTGAAPSALLPEGRTRSLVESASPVATVRRRQRSEAMGSVLKSIASFVIAVISILMVLSELGLDVAPALASAGIAGVALGFGAQNLVKDFLAGIFMIFEDQFGVGDVINMGDATGTVEAVGLRVTRLRDVNGVVWYVRNGEITRVGNESQGWARVVLDVGISPHEDINAVRDLLKQTADGLRHDPDWSDFVVEEPEVWGVESVSPEAVVIRVVVKTKPAERPNVARELRAADQGGLRRAMASRCRSRRTACGCARRTRVRPHRRLAPRRSKNDHDPTTRATIDDRTRVEVGRPVEVDLGEGCRACRASAVPHGGAARRRNLGLSACGGDAGRRGADAGLPLDQCRLRRSSRSATTSTTPRRWTRGSCVRASGSVEVQARLRSSTASCASCRRTRAGSTRPSRSAWSARSPVTST